MRGVCEDPKGPHGAELLSCSAECASGVDHVVDQDTIAAFHAADKVHLAQPIHRSELTTEQHN
jgi:hypothetical protein